MRRRDSDASIAAVTSAGLNPGKSGCWLTLVASTMSRAIESRARDPMMRSDSPPELPGTHAEYESAESMKLPPAREAIQDAVRLVLVGCPSEDIGPECEREYL